MHHYNPDQNYVGQACRMHCLDHRSVFHMETNVLWAKFYLPPSPHAMLFVREGFPKSRPTLHRRGRGERANPSAIREKGTVSHTFWPGLSESRTFTTNTHNSKCMECTVSKFVWVKFVHVLQTSLASRLWKNSFVAISQRFRGQQSATRAYFECARRVSYYAASSCRDSSRSQCSPTNSGIIS